MSGQEINGGSSPPESPPDAPGTVGEQYSEYSLTTGTFVVYAASIHSGNAYQEEARISLISTDSKGAESEVVLESGHVSNNRPFSLSRGRLITGPGFIRGYVINLAATAFSFIVSIDKRSEEKARSGDGFGRWF